MAKCDEAIENCDLLLVIGTAGIVYPAAGFIMRAKRNRTKVCWSYHRCLRFFYFYVFVFFWFGFVKKKPNFLKKINGTNKKNKVANINIDEQQTGLIDIHLQGKSGEILPQIIEKIDIQTIN